MQRILLASQSPRRKELLGKMGVDFDVRQSNYDEKLDESRPPAEVAKELALGKALAVARHYPERIVIGADVIVYLDKRQYGKPRNIDEAREMIKSLSGRTHGVVTGVAVVRLKDDRKLVDSSTSLITLKEYNPEAVFEYINSDEDILDMAGGYGIQSGAAPLVDNIEGDIDTIIGLPTALLSAMLKEFGVDSEPVDYKLPFVRKK